MPFEMSGEFPHFSSKSGVGDCCSCKLSILDTHPSLDPGFSGRGAEPVMSCNLAYPPAKLAQWSDSEDRESQDKQHQEDDQENIEKDSCDIGRCDGDIRKAQQACDDRHQEKNERPSENSHFDVLQCDADLTIVRSHWFRSHQAGPFDILTSVKESIGISRYVSSKSRHDQLHRQRSVRYRVAY